MGESVAVVAGSLKMEGIAVVCCQAGMGSVVASVSVRGAIAVEGMLGRLAVERSTAVAGRAVGLEVSVRRHTRCYGGGVTKVPCPLFSGGAAHG